MGGGHAVQAPVAEPNPGPATVQQPVAPAVSAPAAEHKESHVNIIFKDQDNSEVHFKVRMCTKLEKVFDAFCKHKAVHRDGVRFLFDSIRVRGDDTPCGLRMEDGVVIDAMMEQIGD